MRNTKQKELILEIINNSKNHLTAQETYEEAKKIKNNISLGTVYRILNVLADNHKIIRIPTKFGIDHFDRNTEKNHIHFICDTCYKIIDVFSLKYSYDKRELNNYQVDDVSITLSGICNECKKERK